MNKEKPKLISSISEVVVGDLLVEDLDLFVLNSDNEWERPEFFLVIRMPKNKPCETLRLLDGSQRTINPNHIGFYMIFSKVPRNSSC